MSSPRAASSSWISPSPPSDGGEGWGEEVRFYWFPLSSVLSPLVPRGERMESLMQPCDRAAATRSIQNASLRSCKGRFGCLVSGRRRAGGDFQRLAREIV